MKLSHKLTIVAALLLVMIPLQSNAASISYYTRSIMKAGMTVVNASIQALAPRGSFIAQGQFVCDSGSNPNCGLISGLHAIYIPEPSTFSGSGGNVKVGAGATATAKYEALRTPSAFTGSIATVRGLRTGSSVTLFTVLDIVRNETGVPYDCGIKYKEAAGTGSFKTLMFDSKSATGTYIYATPFVKGATDVGSCGTLGTPKANSDVKMYFYSMESFVGK